MYASHKRHYHSFPVFMYLVLLIISSVAVYTLYSVYAELVTQASIELNKISEDIK